MAYLLDANVFIQAKNLHYGLDFRPAFWEWLIAQNHAGNVFSIEKVGDEVQALEDDLPAWAGARGGGFFLPVGRRGRIPIVERRQHMGTGPAVRTSGHQHFPCRWPTITLSPRPTQDITQWSRTKFPLPRPAGSKSPMHALACRLNA